MDRILSTVMCYLVLPFYRVHAGLSTQNKDTPKLEEKPYQKSEDCRKFITFGLSIVILHWFKMGAYYESVST